MRARPVGRKPARQADLDPDEVEAILTAAAGTLAARGWSAARIAEHLGISLDVAQQAVDAVGSTPD
jgi:hypothetical protein